MIHHILKVTAEAVSRYLIGQIKAGADVIMIFDSWGGSLAHHEYESHSLNYMKVIINNLNMSGYEDIPKIIFTKGGGQWIEKQIESGADALGLDWQTDIGVAKEIANI